MELTQEQLLQIDNYVFVCGIKYYDVRTEIVDHFANILEEKLEENPNLDFKKEIENIHKNFSDRGFQNLLKEKTDSVNKKFYKQSLKHLLTFFKIPKIIISGVLFYALITIMNLFENYNNFFTSLNAFGLFLCFVILWKTASRHDKLKKFLTLGMTINFFQIFHILVVSLQFFNTRSDYSLSNSTHNYLLIGAYVLLFLFFWSGEYVYHQNKKLVREQYPNFVI